MVLIISELRVGFFSSKFTTFEMELEGLINVKSDVQREIKLLAGVFNQQNKTKEERRVSYLLENQH